jgi:peptide/nickel transport system permease protein
MSTYIRNRLIAMLPVLFLVSIIVFMLIRMLPGDPVLIMLGEEATLEVRAALRHELGLDRSIPVQYAVWVGRVIRGDLGRSIRTHQPVLEAIIQRLPVTFELTLLAMVISLSSALPVGIVAAMFRGSRVDMISTAAALVGISIPNFFLAIVLIYVFALKFGWVPPMGYTPPWQDLAANLKAMILPAMTLGIGAAAVVARHIRSSFLEVLGQDYIRTARGKGLREHRVVFTHALKNALIPVVTIVGLQFGGLLGGAIITETIFGLPGVGRLVIASIFERDFPLVQGVVLFVALVFLFTNLVVDVLYAFLDPRIHYG